MLTFCVKCRKNTENVDSKALKTKNGRSMLLSKCAVCGCKKSRFMKEQEGFKTSLSKIPLLGDILFYVYNMNEVINKFLPAEINLYLRYI